MKRKSLILVTILALALMAAPASATLFTASSGNLAASADFTVSGDFLTVVLTNTSTADVLIPVEVLTAIFWSGTSNLSRESATISGSPGIVNNVATQPTGGDVGGEWEYGTNLTNAPGGFTQVISSAGFGLTSSVANGIALFPGTNLDGPVAVDGLNYGITSAGDDPATGNAEVTGNVPLIQNQVTFVLDGATGFDPSTIEAVRFQYGTALTDNNLTVPIPPSALLMGSGLLGLGLVGWRRRRQQA